MFIRQSLLAIVVNAVFLACICVPVSAQDTAWTNTIGGDFFDSSNWDNGVPAILNDAVFDLPGDYWVDLTSDGIIKEFIHIHGYMRLYGGHELIATSRSESTHVLNIEGSGTRVYFPQTFRVGDGGNVTLEQDAELETNILFIAEPVGSQGAMNLLVGAKLQADEVKLGTVNGITPGGVGTLTLEDGGKLLVGNDKTVVSDFVVSGTGFTPQLIVKGGSSLLHEGPDYSDVYIGAGAGSAGRVIVEDPGSELLQPMKHLHIGENGSGELLVSNGGHVISNDLFVAQTATGSGTIAVDGASSLLEVDDIYLGDDGDASFSLTNGAEAIIDSFFIGRGNASATVEVDGFSTYCYAEHFKCSQGIGVSSVAVTGGAELYAEQSPEIAEFPGSTGSLVVAGQDSLFKVDHHFYIGTGFGLQPGGNADVSVISGGCVHVGDDFAAPTASNLVVSGIDSASVWQNGDSATTIEGDAYLAYAVGTQGTLWLSGPNAVIDIGGSLFVGAFGSGAVDITESTLTVQDATSVNANSELNIINGTLDAIGGLSADGSVSLDGGQIIGNVDIGPGCVLTSDGDSTIDGSLTHLYGDIIVNSNSELVVLGNYDGTSSVSGDGILKFESEVTLGPTVAGLQALNTVEFGQDANLNIRLGGTSQADHDHLFIDELVTDLNTQLTITAVNGFLPGPGEQYLIVQRLSGNTMFGSFNEGDLVATISGVGLFITYSAGDGNDIGLYTEVIDVLVPQSFNLVRGTLAAGGELELAQSDNTDVSIYRNDQDVRSETEFEVEAVSLTGNPGSMKIQLEGSVFARLDVTQSILVYDFHNSLWEEVDTRSASRFADRVDVVQLNGDLRRFVDQGSGLIRARVRFTSSNPRQRFTSNTDLFEWQIGQ